MKKAQIVWNGKKYDLVYNGKILVSSKNADHLNYLVVKQKHQAVVAAGITSTERVSTPPTEGQITVTDEKGNSIMSLAPEFSIEERFEFLEQLIMLVVDGDAKSLLITGRGGIGKSWTVIETMEKAGKTDVNKVLPNITDLDDIQVEDEETEIERKIVKQITRPRGDYIVVKGYVTSKYLYKLMYDYRDRTIIFDDCDRVLQDGTCVMLLKAALDSYEERWVSWGKDQQFGETDLPPVFKFTGKIMFISNMDITAVDEAVRTRCLKVDLSMTKEQRIDRMRSVLPNVEPDLDMEIKIDALDLLQANMHLTEDINFRSLLNLITIRKSGNSNWKKLGKYTLLSA